MPLGATPLLPQHQHIITINLKVFRYFNPATLTFGQSHQAGTQNVQNMKHKPLMSNIWTSGKVQFKRKPHIALSKRNNLSTGTM